MLRTCLIGIATASMALTAAPAMADRDRGYREYDDRGRYYEPRRVS